MRSMCVVQGSYEIGDYVKKRTITLNGVEIERTPLLVPSFSSKGFPSVDKIIRFSTEFLDSVTLISAYDLHHKKIEPPFDFASMIFLDSGGYEASKDLDLSDIGDNDHIPEKWSIKFHNDVLDGWDQPVPTAIISYDHPKERLSIPDQIARARETIGVRNGVLREILLKPETGRQTLLNMKSVLANIRDLAHFDIIGVTEKEIGNSILSRMSNIALFRKSLNKIGLDTPLHIFGSLDTITTPLYFVAGADIFDGLTWLRYAYKDGQTIYKQNYGALLLGAGVKAHMIDFRCWSHNYYYLRDLELAMRRFLKDYNFGCFPYHGELIRKWHENTIEAMEE